MKSFILRVVTIILVMVTIPFLFSGCGQQKVTISELAISPQQAGIGDTVTISANVLNSDTKTVYYTTALLIDATKIESREVSVEPGETKTVSFEYTADKLGTFTAEINKKTANFQVLKPAEFIAGSINVIPEDIIVDEEFTINIDVQNIGELPGTFSTDLSIDGTEGKHIDREIAPNTTETISETITLQENGSHSIRIAGKESTVTVLNPAMLSVTSLTVSPTSIYLWESATVKATVSNTGDVTGTFPVELAINGSQIDAESVTLDPGASSDVTFTVNRTTGGQCSIKVGDKTRSLSVTELDRYINPSFYYSISYPPNSTFFDNDPTTVLIQDSSEKWGQAILVDRIPHTFTPDDYLDTIVTSKQAEQPDWQLTEKQEITENGVVIGYSFHYSHTLDGVAWAGQGKTFAIGGYGYYVVHTSKQVDWNECKNLGEYCLETFEHPELFTGSFSDQESGISVTLPNDWDGIVIEQEETLLGFTGPYDSPGIYGKLFVENIMGTMTIVEYGELLASQLESYGYSNVTAGSFSFNDGSTGSIVAARASTSTQNIKIRIISKMRGAYVYSLIFNELASTIDYHNAAITELAKSIALSTPEIAGYPRNETLFRIGGEISSLDPAAGTVGTPDGYIGAIFSGLVKTDRNLDIIGDLAERWTVSEDGTVYTFYLRQNATFHDGKQVTAADVKYSWERACNPDTDSEKAKVFLNDIIGAEAMLNGVADSIEGLTVVDEKTIKVKLTSPIQYFLDKITQPVAYIVDRDTVEQGTNWYENTNGTGPFFLKKWEKDSVLALERYDAFYGGAAKIKYVYWKLFAGNSFTLYEEDEIDITGVYSSNVDRVLDPTDPLNDELIVNEYVGINYVAMNNSIAPFDDVNIRKAFALALDVTTIIDIAEDGRAEQAAGYIPPQVPGYDDSLQPFELDIEQALQLIAESSYGSVENLPEITFSVVYGVMPEQEAMIGMWKDNLGIEVKVEIISTVESYLRKMHDRELQLYDSGWGADYLDPQNFLEVLFFSDSPENGAGYNNTNVDSALTEAGIEPDEAARLERYREIQRMILEDMPIIPLYHSSKNHVLIKPWVKGYDLYPISVNIWNEISLDAH